MSDSSLPGLQIRVVALCGIATFIDGYDVQALGVAVPRLAESLRVAPTSFAAALSGSLIGMALGAVLLAPLADRYGRRPVLVALMLLIGLSTVGVMVSSGPIVLTACRVLTGLGIGGAVPVAVAITSESAPNSQRTALITLVIACMALGSFAAGIVAPILDRLWGWRGIFAPAAILPPLLCLLIWRCLPEPPRSTTTSGARATVRALFTPAYRLRTALLWVIFWFNLFAIYSLISWLPTLLHQAGWSIADAQRAAGLLAVGGIAGGLFLSWLADRGYVTSALLFAYVGSAALLFLFIEGPRDVATGMVWLTMVGVLGLGAQMALVSIAAAQYYPSALRSTGVGWYSGVSRVGAIAGPLVLALLMNAGWRSGTILGLLMIPMLICAAGVLLLPRALRTTA
jgi:AAHS family 4-hydroxybenzoate transporter-like MFS transporter